MNAVIGAGVGGLAAALAWRRQGLPVTVFEAREVPGGLAAGFEANGRRHDGGPYVLLDRPGLEWAFAALGLRLAEVVDPIRLPEPYRVEQPGHPTVVIRDGLDDTIAGLARDFPGVADPYRAFVREMGERYRRLAPLQRAPFRGPRSLLRGGRWRDVRFLLRSLGRVLERSGLPRPIQQALGIWTHVAHQPLDAAPAPMALVPAVIHGEGAWTVRGGLARVVDALFDACVAAGVDFRFGVRVERLHRAGRRIVALEAGASRWAVARVVSDAPALATLCAMLSPPDPAPASRLAALPLQSPGVAAWLEVDPDNPAPFLRFRLADGRCTGLLNPGAVDRERAGLARLLAPVDHAWAERVGEPGQRARLDALLAEAWWREGLGRTAVVATRVPVEWGRVQPLWRDSMNPTMTAAFMRRGRIPHHPAVADNLALCGAATHPGQWVSFCAISGVLATRRDR